MAINAREKIDIAISECFIPHKIIKCREIKDLNAIIGITKNIKGSSFLKYLQKKELFSKYKCFECEYDNGLIYLEIDVIHKELGSDDLTSKRIIAVTTDYEKPSLVSLVINRKDIAIDEVVLSTSPSPNKLSKLQKNIAKQETTIYVASANDNCGSVFTTYKHIPTDTLMMEKYKQYYPVSNHENEETDLIRLCGCEMRVLSIMYNESVPIYAQSSNNYKVEMANFDPNSQSDVKKIVDIINFEVEMISEAITSSIATGPKKHPSTKKKIEKKQF